MSSNKALTEVFAHGLGIEIVNIFVGAKRQQYTVHKELLCKTIPFFCKAFKGGFQEAKMREVYLVDENDDAAGFELLIHWLYKGVIPSIPTDCIEGEPWKVVEADVTPAVIPYHNLYYMAEKWCASLLKNQVLDEICKFHRLTGTHMHPDLIVKGFINTSESSPMRDYLAHAGGFAMEQINKRRYVSKLCESEQDVALEILQNIIFIADFSYLEDPNLKPGEEFHEVTGH